MSIVIYDFDNEMDNIEEPKEPNQVKLMEDNNEYNNEDDNKPNQKKNRLILFLYIKTNLIL